MCCIEQTRELPHAYKGCASPATSSSAGLALGYNHSLTLAARQFCAPVSVGRRGTEVEKEKRIEFCAAANVL